jgi:integrase
MSRAIHRLTGADLKRKQPGRYADGGGLWLQVTTGKQINRSWLFRYSVAGREREMGLGSTHTVSLAEAREAARECRKQRLVGIDPIEERKAQRSAQAAKSATHITFDECADAYHQAHKASWRSEKHARLWLSTMGRYARPIIGKVSVAAVDTALVMRVLEPLWAEKPIAGEKLRAKIARVMDWAIARGYRQGPNPAAWRGHLQQLLPAPSKVVRVTHRAAMPYKAVPAMMADLRKREGAAARALEFLVLTAARSGEALGCRWPEIDLTENIWTIPAHRMKAGQEHRVPLSARCLEILQQRRSVRQGDFVFSGKAGGLGDNACLRQLAQTGYGKFTAHGFRSTFRDWAGETTAFPREIAEAALGHQIGNAVEQAYRRGDALAKRRRLMDAWATFCARPPTAGATVTPIRAVP